MALSKTTTGDLFILSEACLWGLLPVVITLSYFSISPVASLFFSTFFATLFLGGWLTINKQWSQLLIKEAWFDILLVTLLLAVLYYAFYFTGLKYTTPNNVSIIALSESFFSYLFFQLWKKEYFSTRHLIGSILILIGAMIVLLPKTSYWHMGDWFIVCAAMIAPLGNHFQQKARRKVGSIALLFARSLLALPFLFVAMLYFSGVPSLLSMQHSFWFVIVNGCLLFGFSKILWVEGIHRIPVTKAVALSSVAPIFTILFSYLILKQSPTVWQLMAFIPIFFGLFLLTSNKKTAVALEQ